MEIKTKRLILRKPSVKDAKDLARNGNEKDMFYFTWYIPYPFTVSKAIKIIKWLNKEIRKKEDGDKTLAFCITLKNNGEVIGVIDLYDISNKNKRAKIGYWIGKEHRGKGFASEAVKAVLNIGFKKMKLNKISAETLKDNYGSNKLLKRLEFKEIGIKKKHKLLEGKLRDIVLWEILK